MEVLVFISSFTTFLRDGLKPFICRKYSNGIHTVTMFHIRWLGWLVRYGMVR